MEKIKNNVTGYEQTVFLMVETIEKYAQDLKNFVDKESGLTLDKMEFSHFFDYVKNLPYTQDPKGNEIISRPKYIIKLAPKYGRDCKKQSILIASWAKLNGLPYRLKVVSRKNNLKMHHIYPEIKFLNKYLTTDATYNNMIIGQHFKNKREKTFYVKKQK